MLLVKQPPRSGLIFFEVLLALSLWGFVILSVLLLQSKAAHHLAERTRLFRKYELLFRGDEDEILPGQCEVIVTGAGLRAVSCTKEDESLSRESRMLFLLGNTAE